MLKLSVPFFICKGQKVIYPTNRIYHKISFNVALEKSRQREKGPAKRKKDQIRLTVGRYA